jgi:two-component system, OmpR family, sensor kinase
VMRITEASQRQQVDRRIRLLLPVMFTDAAERPGGRPPSAGTPPNDASPGDSDVDNPFSDVYMSRVASDGSRVVEVRPSQTSAEPNLPALSPRPPAPLEISTVSSTGDGPRWRAAMLDGPPGSPRRLIAVSMESADATLAQLRAALFATGAVLLGALALAGWWVVRLGLRPITEVTAAADAITSGDRSLRLPVTSARTEAGHLATAFNVMLDEHDADDRRRRQFVADAAHELRTPVAAIRGFAELYRTGTMTDADVNQAMRRIGGESSRLSGLVDDMLLLARLDEGRPLDDAPVDLAPMLRDAAIDAGATHPSRTVTADAHGALTVRGDAPRLRQVIANLVTNALVHGAPGAVSISGRRNEQHVVIDVSDDGPGMNAADIASATQRFWRGDRARQGTGSGLGLSIVDAIVRAHGGRMVITPGAAGRGTSVRVVMPAGEEPALGAPR